MHAVFYDLETSDKNPIGQILNYCFIFLDPQGQPLDELSDLIKISRLQIPDPGAILANRTNVLEHQQRAHDYEGAAMQRIAAFVKHCIMKASGAVALIGYNSSRFDLAYLRTSLIRNGINPYFDKKIIPRDLLHVVQKAYLTSEEFRARIVTQRVGEQKLSLSLQTVGHALGLLSGEQAHESRADVVLTIKVAEWIRAHCGIDVTTFEAYGGLRLHSTARTGAVYLLEEPEYDLSEKSFMTRTPVTLLDADHRAGLWINLERYASNPDAGCIMWRSVGRNAFFVSEKSVSDPELQRTARAAVSQFKKLHLRNYFEKSTCDIEQDIYRLDFSQLDLYSQAVASRDKEILKGCSGPEAKVLWARRQLGNPEASLSDPKMAEMLKKYALYRYGGQLQLSRTLRSSERQEADYHATLGEIVRRLSLNRDAAAIQGNAEDTKLLDALEQFIRNSEIATVAGRELLPMWYS